MDHSGVILPAQALRHHLDYNIWATQCLLAAVADLNERELTHDFHTADPTIPATLAHVYRSERAWLSRLQTNAVGLPGPHDMAWPELHACWRAWTAQLNDADSRSVINYTDMKGRPWSHPLWLLLFHVVNHSTHHRGQVSGFLRALGHTPPPLDFIYFVRINGAVGEPVDPPPSPVSP